MRTSICSTFGRRIRQRRLELSLTQEQLAEIADVSVDTVKKYESESYDGIKLTLAYDIAVALDVSIQALLPQQEHSPEQLLIEAEMLIRTAREIHFGE